MKAKRFFARHILFPFLVLVFPLLGVLVYRMLHIFSAPAISNLLVIIGGLIIVLFEHQVPFSKPWNIDRNDTRTDIVYAIANTIVFAITEIVIIFAAYKFFNVGLIQGCIHKISGGFWLVKFAIFYFLVELLQYIYHWFAHSKDFLWRLHEIHHSSERLYSINSLKMHAIEAVMRFSLPAFLLVIIGGSTETMLIYAIHSSLLGLLQHANIDIHIGFWNRIFNTPDLHRVHHSIVLTESKKNLGKSIILYDLLFRTYARKDCNEVGLKEKIPKQYWRQLLSPFYKK